MIMKHRSPGPAILVWVLPTLLGKIEFEMGEEGREQAVLDHLLRLAVAATIPATGCRAWISPASPTFSPKAES